MCITDKAKETSYCADLFRCRAVCFAWSARLFALPLGWLSLSSACLDATTISHASGAWSRIFHLMQVCCLPCCPARPVLCVLRAWLPRSLACPVCCAPGAWAALPAGALVAVLCGWAVHLAPWPPDLPCAGGLCAPCVWACPVGCLAGPYFPALYCGLPGWASEKGLYFRPVFFRNF